MLRLHYVPGGHGSPVSAHRGRNGMNVLQRDETLDDGMSKRNRP